MKMYFTDDPLRDYDRWEMENPPFEEDAKERYQFEQEWWEAKYGI